MPLDLHSIAADARLLEEIGYDGLVVEETKDDPFILLSLAAQTTRTLKLGTSVAIAFPRSPTVTAMSAWTLQKLSRGRFTLGLGTQVKAHIERRFGMPLDACRAVDARVRECGSRGLGLLAKRHVARHQGAALQHQSDGAFVQSGPDPASQHSHSCGGGEPADVSGGG
jgi:alkanesulfonate monooxygenase SsuD/methylene tetrahydromethanopterin reductase-like flavin-dependent oxidoreductase (luciferase family)